MSHRSYCLLRTGHLKEAHLTHYSDHRFLYCRSSALPRSVGYLAAACCCFLKLLFEILLLKIQVRPVTRRVDERFPASTRPTAEREL